MIALALLLCVIGFIAGLIIKAVEIAKETGSTVIHKSSDFVNYVKTQWEEVQNDTQV